jgi:hypothetical protein
MIAGHMPDLILPTGGLEVILTKFIMKANISVWKDLVEKV